VTISLDARSFQYWNGAWTNASGVHTVSVGASSMDLRLTGQVSIAGGVVTPPPGTNLAQGKPVTATGSVGGYPPGNAVDGNTGSVTIPSTTQRYFRLTFTGNTGWPAAQLSELRLYGS
jgi:beta-glucosidase